MSAQISLLAQADAGRKRAEQALEQVLARAEQMDKSPSRLVRKEAEKMRAAIAAAMTQHTVTADPPQELT